MQLKLLRPYKWLLPYALVFGVGILAGGGSVTFTSGDTRVELHGRQQEKMGLMVQNTALRKQLEECK